MAENEGQESERSRRPQDTAFKQQRLRAWQPILTPKWVISIFIGIGVLFIILGIILKSASDQIVEYNIQYAGDGTDEPYATSCNIDTQNAGTTCNVTFSITSDMEAPVYFYYRLTNFYQNHRRYVKSLYWYQLQGKVLYDSDSEENCDPLVKNGTQYLNPCGLIANSLFNDAISLSTPGFSLRETGIAWPSDMDAKFAQPEGFDYVALTAENCPDASNCTCSEAFGSDAYGDDCGFYTEGNASYAYYYPEDDAVQYLYETYPQVVNPIEGVTNEHFVVWMRTAALPTFRKLYGVIETDIPAGTELTFTVENNFLVDSFDGTKGLVLSTTSWFGGRNPFLGIAYAAVGACCVALGLAFFAKHRHSPRKLGDTRYLVWKEQ